MRKIETPPDYWEADSETLNRMRDPEIKSLIDKINENYFYWDKVKHYKTKMTPQQLWIITKLSRDIHSKSISFGEYTFKYNISDYILKELHQFDLYIGGSLYSEKIIPEKDKNIYLISSIMEEAIASSQIEGAVTTRRQAKEMLRKKSRPKNKSEQMIFNNYETIRHIVEIKAEPISLEKLFEIHHLITKDTLENAEDEGRYRDNNDVNVVDVVDGEVIYTPPDHTKISGLMDELFTFFNSEKDSHFIHPIIKGCIIHFMIGFIHPFVDGNGRTARALFYWYLLKNGYWLTEYLSISRLIVRSKTKYALAYLHSETDENDLTYFINYKIKTMQLAYESLRVYIQRQLSEKQRIIQFNRISGINERQAIILNWIDAEPNLLLTVKEVETRLNVSNQTARTDLLELENKKLLESTDLNKRTKGFFRSREFETMLKALTRD